MSTAESTLYYYMQPPRAQPPCPAKASTSDHLFHSPPSPSSPERGMLQNLEALAATKARRASCKPRRNSYQSWVTVDLQSSTSNSTTTHRRNQRFLNHQNP
ncbi:hypothetical protein ACLB2K_002350 [Fragaria x ananassa]